jgi:hypothetical protein
MASTPSTFVIDWKAVQKLINKDPKALLRLVKDINAAFPYPTTKSPKCGFHGQITKPLEDLVQFEVRDKKLYRVNIETDDATLIDPMHADDLRIAGNVDTLTPLAIAVVRRYLAYDE